MSNGDGSTTTPRRSTKYTERSTQRKERTVVYLDPALREYAEAYCKAGGISMSRLVNDLMTWLRDEA